MRERLQLPSWPPWGGPFLMVLAVLVSSAPAQAQLAPEPSVEALEHMALEDLMRVAVSAPSKLTQPLRESPSVGAVLTRQQIDLYGWSTLNDVLFRQPGFAPSQDYERVTVSARGLYEGWNNNHLLTLVDGVPFNNGTNGFAYTWDVVPLILFDSLEIIRGPGSALYGTNATNGVVALYTRQPRADEPVEALVSVGSDGRQSYELFAGHAFAPVTLSAAYAYRRDPGNEYDSYDGSGRVDASGALRRFRVNDQHDSHYLFAKAAGEGALSGLSAQLHHQWWSFQTGHGWLYVVPDADERAVNTESRLWVSYRPRPLLAERLQLELVALGQRHTKDYRIKYLPDGASFGGVTFPSGVVEVIETAASNLFLRAQAQLRLVAESNLMVGVENNLTAWGSDKVHLGNVDLNTGGSFQPFPGGELRPLRSSLEKVQDHPVDNLGLFAQLGSGRILDQRVSATAGVRYDVQFFRYLAIDDPSRPERERSFDQLSPRLALVLFPHQTLALKGLLERAFRAPSPSELFVANSLLATSETELLQPEQITTVTVAADFSPWEQLTLRADWFHERFDRQIAFSASRNRSANLYSRRLTGVEAEALFEVPVASGTALGGFANYTYSHLLGEEILEPGITARDRLTWAPAQVVNLGLHLRAESWSASAQLHHQSRVYRRDSDRYGPAGIPTAASAYRPGSVPPWYEIDASVAYQIVPWLRLGVQGTNLLDASGTLIKFGDYPFDYQREGLRVLGTIELTLKSG